MKVSVPKTGNVDKRVKRAEKMAVSEKLTNGFMLTLTYGVVAIFLLEIARRHYMSFALDFASKYCIVFGVLFAVLTAGAVVWGIIKADFFKKSLGYTVFFAVSSLASFFLSYDMRLPISRALFAKGEYWSGIDFLANLDLARDAKFVEYGVVAYVALAFIVYAINLARVEKKK